MNICKQNAELPRPSETHKVDYPKSYQIEEAEVFCVLEDTRLLSVL